jgi:membrane associated rhomboid family serine protease
MSGFFGSGKQGRPQLCPSCGTLVGANATKCHQCGANLTFSIAAASRSLEKLFPTAAPATYGILGFSCLIYITSLLATMRTHGLQPPTGGGIAAIMNLGAISGDVLQRFGASLPLPYDIAQPWRLVMAVFLHGSLMHIVFNMWVLMDFGPELEEAYGSARFFFIYVLTGIGGYILSSLFGHFAIGGSGAILGICGLAVAITTGRRDAASQMLRERIWRLLIYLIVIAILPFGFLGNIDNMAHIGGFASGFVLGKIMTDRPPSSPEERNRANALGWATAAVVAVSLAMVVKGILQSS